MKAIGAGLSDVGRQREHNEDRFVMLPEHSLYVVADGMGGHRAGDVASSIATTEVAEFFKTTMSEDITWPFPFDAAKTEEENRLICGIKLANRKIFDKALGNRELHGMGTTVVGLLYAPKKNQVYVAHVGDSRCYRVRAGMIEQLTRDHSLINEYLQAMPELPSEQRDNLPKNVITRALGMHDQVQVDVKVDVPHVGDVYVLCSDGLSGMVSDQEIADIVTTHHEDLDTGVKKLIERANEHGGEDNVTAILVKVTEEGTIISEAWGNEATLPG
ncbi:MAG: Stp1/IreP family PP2C-type Ser/Thr phosphatase [Polyangiales bacterium]